MEVVVSISGDGRLRIGIDTTEKKPFWNASSLALCSTCCEQETEPTCPNCPGLTVPSTISASYHITTHNACVNMGSYYAQLTGVEWYDTIRVPIITNPSPYNPEELICWWYESKSDFQGNYTTAPSGYLASWVLYNGGCSGSYISNVLAVSAMVKVNGKPNGIDFDPYLGVYFHDIQITFPIVLYYQDEYGTHIIINDGSIKMGVLSSVYLAHLETGKCLDAYNMPLSVIECRFPPPICHWATGGTVSVIEGDCTQWVSTESYSVGDCVGHKGIFYDCTTGHTNQEPPNASYWSART